MLNTLNTFKNESFISTIIKIISLIDENQWNRVKTLWIINILKLQPDVDWRFSTYGSEYEFLIKPFLSYQEFQFKCSHCNNHISKTKNEFFFTKANNNLNLNFETVLFCTRYNKIFYGSFIKKPYCLFIGVNNTLESPISLLDIPATITLDNLTFCFLCFTFGNQVNGIKHFKSVFYLNKGFYCVDDLKGKQLIRKIPDACQISYCFYYLKK